MSYDNINASYMRAKTVLLNLELRKEKWETRLHMLEETQQKAICEQEVHATHQGERRVQKNDEEIGHIEEIIGGLEIKIDDKKKEVELLENRLIQASAELTPFHK